MLNDLRIAVRNLSKLPWFAVAFILTLGLGIGANTAIFSVINGVLLRPLPYPDADRIMHLRQVQAAAGIEDSSFSFAEVADYRAQAKTIDQFVEFGDWTFNVLGRGEPHRATGGLVTANFFQMLGAHPQYGRMLVPADEAKGAPPVVGAHRRVLAADLRRRSERDRTDARSHRQEGADRRRARARRALCDRSASRISTSTTKPTITT